MYLLIEGKRITPYDLRYVHSADDFSVNLIDLVVSQTDYDWLTGIERGYLKLYSDSGNWLYIAGWFAVQPFDEARAARFGWDQTHCFMTLARIMSDQSDI